MTDNMNQENTPVFKFGEEHYDIIQKLSHLGSWKVDMNTLTVTASIEGCKIFGVEYKAHSLESIQLIPLPGYRAAVDAELERLLNGGTYDIEFKIRRPLDGEIRDIHSVAEYDKDKNIVIGAIHDVTKQKTVERALQESEARYRRLFDNAVSGILYAGIDGRLIDINSKMLGLLGSPSIEETMKINVLEYSPLVDVGFSEKFKEVIDDASVKHGSARYVSKWGVEHYLDYVLNPVMQDGRVVRIIGRVEDISERKAAEKKVKQLLDEKDILLREIHHRLKNNMASIESLLKIQLNSSDDERVNAPLQDAVGRLSSMRILYDKLYLSADFIHTSINDYLSTLINEIFEVFPGSRDVEIIKEIQDFPIPSDKIFPLGLIFNELLTNSFKYAFAGRASGGKLNITVLRSDGQVRLIVRDNGNGFSSTANKNGSGGFGLQLVSMLTDQIGGNVMFKNDGGAVCEIEFEL